MKPTRPTSAFTLLELVLVLMIITIVVGAVVPSLRGFTMGRSSKNTATRLLAMTNYARTQAISEGRSYRLNYNAATRSFWLDYADGVALPEDIASRLEVDERLAVHVSNMSTGSTGDHYIEFRPSGRMTPASIVIVDQSNAEIEVACSSATELFRIVPESERIK
jgi:type II secretion system protein H